MMIRIAAFDWLVDQVDIHGDVPPGTLLQEGIEFQGQRTPLIVFVNGKQGQLITEERAILAILHFVSRKQGHQGVILGIVGTVLYVVVLAIGIVLRLSKSYLGGL